MFAGDQARLCRPLRRDKARQGRDLRVVVDGKEQRKGVALLLHLADTVRGRDEGAIGPKFEHIANIDHEGTRNRRRVDPNAVTVQDFEPGHCRMQQGEALVIGVGTDAHRVDGIGSVGVVDQPQL